MRNQHQPVPPPRRRVLIVEDGARFRAMLTRAIQEMDFVPHPVDSGESAIESLEEEPVEIAMVDLGLPGMSGLELCQYLREHDPSVQIIILTGYGDLDAAKQAIRLGVVDFLTKPCDHSELEQALDRAFRRLSGAQRVAPPPNEASAVVAGNENSNGLTMEQIERESILKAIQRSNGNRALAAKELGISVRTLYYRLSRYKMLDRFNR